MIDVLVMAGPCGVEKSSVACECMQRLEEAATAAAMVDAERAAAEVARDGLARACRLPPGTERRLSP